MAAAADHQWLAALQQVKQLHGLAAPPAPPAGQTDGYFSVQSIIPTGELSDTQWKRLIKAKVPYELGAACSSPLTGPGSHSSSAVALTASFQLLGQLLTYGSNAGLFTSSKPSSRTTAKQNLGQTLLQQLHWSGALVGGRLGVLQLLVEDDAAGFAFEGPFLSLLFSMLRLAGGSLGTRDAFGMQQVVCNVLYSAVDMLGRVSAPQPEQTESDRGAADVGGPGVAAGGPGAVEGGPGTADGGPGAVEGEPGAAEVLRKLPCVVLFGRCCALLADSFEGIDMAAGISQDGLKFVRYFTQQGFAAKYHTVAEWLQGSGPRLSAAGYSLEPMQQQLCALGEASAAAVAAIRGVATASAAAAAAAAAADMEAAQVAVGEFVQQLRGFADAAAAVAVPNFCSHPGCGNVSGVSEAALVSGRSCICAGCRTARYCSRVCQKQHWKQQHKPVCQALAAAAAAAAGASGTTSG